MIISALATYMKDDRNIQEVVKFYPFISYIEEDGSKRKEIMNKYFVMKTVKEDKRPIEEIK